MSRTLRAILRIGLPAACALVVSFAGATSASAATIGPNQYFSGNVNGATSNATILVDCVGPVVPGATGHPLPNQYVLATREPASTTTNIGYTGSAANALVVSLRLTTSSGTTAYLIGTLTAYDTRLAIPTTLTLPCAATGTVVFTPTPTSTTAKPALVSVRVTGLP